MSVEEKKKKKISCVILCLSHGYGSVGLVAVSVELRINHFGLWGVEEKRK